MKYLFQTSTSIGQYLLPTEFHSFTPIMPKLLPILLILISTLSCKTQTADNPKTPGMIDDSTLVAMQAEKKKLADQMSKAKIEYFVINVPDNQFGYYIMIDGQMYIEQKSIPAIQGLKGFKTKDEAEKVAQRVIQKIREGEMPPTIEVNDLDSLGVKY